MHLRAGVAIAVLLGVVAAPALAAGPFVDGEVGGGYESNLDASSTSSQAAGAGFGRASIAVGLASEPDRVRYQVAARWSGLWYTDYADLSVNRITAIGGVYARLADGWIASVAPSIGGSFYGDGDRDSFELASRFGLRWHLHDRLGLRPAYTILWDDARADAFDRTAHRFSLDLDADVWPGGWLVLGGAIELGPVPRYIDASLVSGGGGPGMADRDPTVHKLIGTFGRSQLVVRTDATAYDLSLDLEQTVARWLRLRVGGGYSHVTADPAPYDAYFFSGSIGVQWP